MSTIANKFKKWASAWGIEPKGHTIEDTVENIVDNLPFGVKTEMVKIVPEQSLTGELMQGYYGKPGFTVNLLVDKNYEVVINSVKYKSICKSIEIRGATFHWVGNLSLLNTVLNTNYENTGEPFFCELNVDVTEGSSIMWLPILGETITLSIYEEKETVTPMNAEFANIIISKEDGIFSCNATYAELRKMYENGALSVVNVKYVEKTSNNTETDLRVQQLKYLIIYETQFSFDFGDYNSSTVILYNSDGTIGNAGPV